uniref:Calcium-transporting ATPase n=1 Tax=Arcella intermedia TaxID=1963864 RepID=A0A6B2KX59_9EUKA
MDPPKVALHELFIESLKDPAVIILLLSALVSFIAGSIEAALGSVKGDEWLEGLAILVAVLIVALVTSINNYLKNLQFEELKKRNAKTEVRVIRDSEEKNISNFEVCVGDIVLLHSGDKIPADGIFFSGSKDVRSDESSISGESFHKKKNDKTPFLFSGCYLTKGSCKMLVTGVGMHSTLGKTISLIPDEHPPTPLQEKLEDLVTMISKIGLTVGVLVFFVLAGYYLYDSIYPVKFLPCSKNLTEIVLSEGKVYNCSLGMSQEQIGRDIPHGHIAVPSSWEKSSLMQLLNAFIIAITIVVVAVPEGLPLAVTISLAYSMKQMTEDNNLVRHLAACETMGGVNSICSDKTGTLTQNKMSLKMGYVYGIPFYTWNELEKRVSDHPKDLFLESFLLNNEDGLLVFEPNGIISFAGSTTECALLEFIHRIGTIQNNKIIDSSPVVCKFEFTSDRKMMSTIVKHSRAPFRMFTKGAPEKLLRKSITRIAKDGSIEVLDDEGRDEILGHVENLGKEGYRTLGLAFRDFDTAFDWDEDECENKLTWIGVLGIEDPVRPEVPHSVSQCQVAGITVRMITGDNITTAIKIARDCYIMGDTDIAIEGPKFSAMSDDEVRAILRKLKVIARATPKDKFRLVRLLQNEDEVVAVTGDGTNDAPALSAADVGLAMGITGTDVAKQAADIIILDDNFASIVKSVMWGRCVFENVRKFLQFQMTVNVAALVVAFVGAITGYGTPLNAIQLLWVNLIMDTLAALALGTAKPSADLLLRKPYGRFGKIISLTMWRNIIGQSLLQIAILCFLLYGVDSSEHLLIFPAESLGKHAFEAGAPSVHYTIIFNVFVLCQVFNEFNARKVNNDLNVFTGLFDNPLFCIIVLVVVFFQVILVQFGGNVVKTVPLSVEQWLVCIAFSILSLPFGLLLRLIRVPLEPWEKVVEEI